ncbi:DinB family protein [Pseudalkalibacillus hwajinpoensis]|uniref:DinB family protein n=1 Tax=Guptibacillus hwajinpoensis TaxID=208199 RepID=UPI00325B6DF3
MTDGRYVLDDYASFMDWLQKTATEMSDELFFTPIKNGKWSPAEIISHIKAWDDFLLEERIPYIKNEASLSEIDVKVEQVNSQAAEHAMSGISKEELIEEGVYGRERVVARLKQFEPTQWEETFYITKYPLCLTSYMKGLIEHDEHHKLQIEVFMSEHGISISPPLL